MDVCLIKRKKKALAFRQLPLFSFFHYFQEVCKLFLHTPQPISVAFQRHFFIYHLKPYCILQYAFDDYQNNFLNPDNPRTCRINFLFDIKAFGLRLTLKHDRKARIDSILNTWHSAEIYPEPLQYRVSFKNNLLLKTILFAFHCHRCGFCRVYNHHSNLNNKSSPQLKIR